MTALLILYFLLWIVVIVGTLLPLIHKKHWIFRVFEFPRVQKFTLAALAVLLGTSLQQRHFFLLYFNLPLSLALVYIGYLIFPFTPLAPRTVFKARQRNGVSIKLLVANVYQYNTRYDKLCRLIKRADADLLLFVETDKKWMKNLRGATDAYPHRIEIPLDNTYGMLFYSRFELSEAEVRHLVDEEYPSIRCMLKMEDDFPEVLFYGIHPPPPSPTEETYSTDRDKELIRVARELEDYRKPTLVAGDLNDVAWSYTTDRFIEVSGMKDPRKGRGIFATFHAKYFLMRWPLDHIFCSHHFSVIRMGRPGKINSDHFPVSITLQLDPISENRPQGRTAPRTK